MKAMTDRESKSSAKRVSLLNMEKIEIVPSSGSMKGSEDEKKN